MSSRVVQKDRIPQSFLAFTMISVALLSGEFGMQAVSKRLPNKGHQGPLK